MNQYQQPYVQQQVDPVAYAANLDARLRALEMRIPATSLLAPSFMKRAFAVWGHMFVASFVVGLIMSVLGFVASLVFAGSIAGILNSAGGGL